MAGPKAQTPAPIDRPLSRAYLREFGGWQTAYPPGMCDPNTFRVMENVVINRDGSCAVRPGLRYISYSGPPGVLGIRPILKTLGNERLISSPELFYLNDGRKAYLCAITVETMMGSGVTFVAIVGDIAYSILDPEIGFTAKNPNTLGFSTNTTYVKFLQIDNKIVALSNNNEEANILYVGKHKRIERPKSLDRAGTISWDQPTVVHPSGYYYNLGLTSPEIYNYVYNPTFEKEGVWTGSADINLHYLESKSAREYKHLELTFDTHGPLTDHYIWSADSGAYPELIERIALERRAYAEFICNDPNVEYCVWYSKYPNNTTFWPNAAVDTGWISVGSDAGKVIKKLTPGISSSGGPFVRMQIGFRNTSATTKVWMERAAITETVAYSAFAGSDPADDWYRYGWRGRSYNSASIAVHRGRQMWGGTAATPSANSLISSDPAKNTINYGFFYTLENVFGESTCSRMIVVKAQRHWSQWIMKQPATPFDAENEPHGSTVYDSGRASDQFHVKIPEPVYLDAKEREAEYINVYMACWGPTESVPVEGIKVGRKKILYRPGDVLYDSAGSLGYAEEGFIQVTAEGILNAEDSMPLPGEFNRINSSEPPRGAQGLVADDRMIIVDNGWDAATIRWTSNYAEDYLNFTPNVGGGVKTLSSGNLNRPVAVQLWQNPESKDTLTVLCKNNDGYSKSYYMAPTQIGQQTDATTVMGFEETTNTPGTTSTYGVEVLNNSLWRPTEEGLVKSTASNYNLNHKVFTDGIVDQWQHLSNMDLIMSSQLDNKLYYLVHKKVITNENPTGALPDGYRGNEVWVLDTAAETPVWSRWLVGGLSLKKIVYDGHVVMSISTPDGLFIFDKHYMVDDYVDGITVKQRDIEWQVETNTQGANRAHDAWAHLQQANVMLGNLYGSVEWGIRGVDRHGKDVEIKKVSEQLIYSGDSHGFSTQYDFEDFLLVKRDMKEWRFFAKGVPHIDDAPPEGQRCNINLVQYRYTPISVNVGYENGSVESFQYSNFMTTGSNQVYVGGVPIENTDRSIP